MMTWALIGFWINAAALVVTLVKLADTFRPEPVPVEVEDDEWPQQ